MKNICFVKITPELVFRIIDDGTDILEISRAENPCMCCIAASASIIGQRVKNELLLRKNELRSYPNIPYETNLLCSEIDLFKHV